MYIYIITEASSPNGPCRIGQTDRPLRFLREIQSGNPRELTIAYKFHCTTTHYAKHLKLSIHTTLSGKKLNFGWFNISPEEAESALHECRKLPWKIERKPKEIQQQRKASQQRLALTIRELAHNAFTKEDKR